MSKQSDRGKQKANGTGIMIDSMNLMDVKVKEKKGGTKDVVMIELEKATRVIPTHPCQDQ